MPTLPFRTTLAAVILISAPTVHGQGILDRARQAIDKATETAGDITKMRCDVQGECGKIHASADFAPARYSSLAVAVTEASGRTSPGELNAIREVFEGELITNGYMIAPNADVTKVRELFSKGDASWNDRELKELAEFVTGIDAVLVLEIRQGSRTSCRIGNRSGVEANVQLSARWLNTPAGDVPWIGVHEASACAERETSAVELASHKVAEQLAGRLPERNRNHR